jgi:hypothetical protein
VDVTASSPEAQAPCHGRPEHAIAARQRAAEVKAAAVGKAVKILARAGAPITCAGWPASPGSPARSSTKTARPLTDARYCE